MVMIDSLTGTKYTFICFVTDNYDELFCSCISLLPELWVISEAHCKQLDDVKVTNPNIELPEIHKEVFDNDDKH